MRLTYMSHCIYVILQHMISLALSESGGIVCIGGIGVCGAGCANRSSGPSLVQHPPQCSRQPQWHAPGMTLYFERQILVAVFLTNLEFTSCVSKWLTVVQPMPKITNVCPFNFVQEDLQIIGKGGDAPDTILFPSISGTVSSGRRQLIQEGCEHF